MARRNYWNEERIQKLKEIYPHVTIEELEKAFPGKKIHTIRQAASLNKIRRPRRDRWLPEQIQLIKNYFPKSHSDDLADLEREKMRLELITKINDLSMNKGLPLKTWHKILVEANKFGLDWRKSETVHADNIKKGKGDSLEEKFIAFIKENPRSITEISNFLNLSSRESIRFIDGLRRKGYPIETDSTYQQYFWQESTVRGGATSLPSLMRNSFKILVLSDINIGNKAQQLTLLHTLYQLVNTGYCDDSRGIDFRDINMVVVLGNLLAGHQRKGENELFIDDFDAQTDYAIIHFPKLEGGIKTYVLSGPAELDLNKPKGKEEARDALQKVCLVRDDMVHLGALGHTLQITGTDAEVYLAHTANRRTRSLYTKSIPLQYVAHSFDDLSALRRGKKRPVAIFLGGHHVFMVDPPVNEDEERHALLVPSFCDPISSFRDREKQGATPTIGFVITTIQFDSEKKKIKKVIHEPHFWTNRQIERDYLVVSAHTDEHDGKIDASLNDDEKKILGWLSSELLTGGELSRRLNLPKAKVREILANLERLNVLWDPAQKHYFMEQPPREKFESLTDIPEFMAKTYAKRVKRIIYSDTHIGSLWEQKHAVKIIGRIIESSGVKEVYHCGDVLDGENLYGPKHKRNIYLFSSKSQRDKAAERLPKIPGVTTNVITGSHDMIFSTQSGEDPIALLCKERPDLCYLGPYEGIAVDSETGIRHMLLHPSGGVPKGRSYRIQGIIDMLSEQIDSLTDDIHGLFIGHLHVALGMFWRGVFCLLVPCCQGRTEYLVQKGLHPRMGCWELEQSVDENNDPTQIKLVYYAIDTKKYVEKADLELVEEVKK